MREGENRSYRPKCPAHSVSVHPVRAKEGSRNAPNVRDDKSIIPEARTPLRPSLGCFIQRNNGDIRSMKHIKTLSQAEKSMRGLYKTATDGTPVKATAEQIKLINGIIAKTQQVDLLKLEISEDMGKLMGVMQEHSSMTDANDRVRITWENGGEKTSIDYDALLLELDVPPSTIEKFKIVTPGSRVFTVFE